MSDPTYAEVLNAGPNRGRRYTTETTRYHALGENVLVVAMTRIEGTWKAYIGAVPGICHRNEWQAVLLHGDQLDESLARLIFPEFDSFPYAS